MNSDSAENTNKLKDKQKMKIEKIRKETKPSLEEEVRIKEELELTKEYNPIYKQVAQNEEICERFKKRMKYLQKGIDEKMAKQ